MTSLFEQNDKFYREIPDKKDPGKVVPEKSRDQIPGTRPDKDNPRNPKEDLSKKFN